MKAPFKTIGSTLCMILLLLGSFACGDDDSSEPSFDCTVDVTQCLTNGSRQVYYSYSSEGVLTTNECFKSIQMGFEMNGTFTWDSDSDMDENCMDLIGFENFTGNWTLENNKTEIHITPPFYTNNGQTKTVFEIVSLTEQDLTAESPTAGGVFTIVWRRLGS